MPKHPGLQPIETVAADLGVAPEHLSPRGRDAAKIDPAAIGPARGKLVLVSAITPTPAGEGKTTVSVGLAMGLSRLGRRTVACLREPSLGPVFGIKGGGTGGGRATVQPEQRINLHFTGDLHAVTAAHNLLAAMIDNDLYFGGASGLEPRTVDWPRVLDVNDRALRDIVIGLGSGVPRQTRFDITAASEIMAVLCLASSLDDLRARLGRIVVGRRDDGGFVTADDLGAAGAMTALLAEALWPNLAQTAEGGPALVHGGPFANIAHGCSSVLATRLGLAHAEIAITEAGFGFDLGGEKLLDIKCRAAGVWPHALVLVATLRALKMHGGAPLSDVDAPGPDALIAGLESNLAAHVEAANRFGFTPIVALNEHASDTEEELARAASWCAERGLKVARCAAFARGGEGAEELATAVLSALDDDAPRPHFLYALDAPLADKVDTLARCVYGADGVDFTRAASKELELLEKAGYGGLPVCVAKTYRSLSDDAKQLGRPRGFRATVREVRLSAGAGFVVVLMGDVMTMPGLPRRPAALDVGVDADGTIHGLMRSH